MGEYPTAKELRTLRAWNLSQGSIMEFLDYIRAIWWAPDWGYTLSGKRVLRLALHTGGWSGNEEIIEALQRNYLFWPLCWRKETVGGHYWFRIDTKEFRR